MRTDRLLRSPMLFLGFVFSIFSTVIASAQQSTQSGADANAVLGQLATAFSGGQLVNQVQLSGNATWYAGSLEDTGSVSLTASSDGSSQMQLMLASAGQRIETQTGSGSTSTCQWAGNDGVSHDVSQSNCWKPTVWFLPAISIQPSLLPNYLGMADLGTGTVGTDGSAYRHVLSELVFSYFPDTLAATIAQQSATDLGLDPASLLPAVLAYSVYPDNGVQTPIAIEIHYSDYCVVNGVQVPFLIQRYVNGSLQLQISVSVGQVD